MLLLLLVATCCSFYRLTECGTCCRSKLALLNKNMPFVWLPVSTAAAIAAVGSHLVEQTVEACKRCTCCECTLHGVGHPAHKAEAHTSTKRCSHAAEQSDRKEPHHLNPTQLGQ